MVSTASPWSLCPYTIRWDQTPVVTLLIKVKILVFNYSSLLVLFADIFILFLTAEMSLVICDNEDKCKLLLNKPPDCLKQLVHIKPISKETIESAKRKNINILSFECVQRIGAERKHIPMVILENL
jgi:hypothetical protein